MIRKSPDTYQKLAEHLDALPGGFPRTETGAELRILRQLFSEEEAYVASQLMLLPETARVIARRTKLPLKDMTRILHQLADKRLVTHFSSNGEQHYMAQQFVIGFWEEQVDRLEKDLVEAFEEYFPLYSDAGLWGKAPQLRTIPVQKSLTAQSNVMPYDNIHAIIEAHQFFAVANCICRQEQHLLGKDCGKPEGTCLAFDGAAQYFIQTGRGKRIAKADVLALLEKAEKSGLVLQPGNIRNPDNVCMCCGCCCGVLRGIKRFPKPSEQVASDYYAILNDQKCTGCGVCVKRCQMDALRIENGKAVLDRDHCIGCGLCVTTCKPGALDLVQKPKRQMAKVYPNTVSLAIQMGRSHGRLGLAEILSILFRSARDRVSAWLEPPK